MANKPRPQVDDLYELAKSLVKENAARDTLYDRLDRLYDQETGKTASTDSEDVQIIRMPYATNVIDLITDLASQMTLTIEVPAQKESKDAQKEADNQEGWLQAWLSQNEKRRQSNVTADLAWLGAMRSRTCIRTLFLDSMVDKDEEQGYKLKNLPVILQVRDPRYVYVCEGPEGPEYVVEASKRKVADIRRHYPGALVGDAWQPADLVDWVEYWDDTYRCYWADEEPIAIGKSKKKLEVVPHGFGCLPYAFGTARSTPRNKPEKKYRPILAGVEDNLRNIDTWYSILATAGWASVTNAWAVYSDNMGRDGGPRLDTSPGAVNYLASNEKLQAIQRGEMPADFFRLGDLLLQAYQQGTLPFAIYGQTQGSMAGYAINMLNQSGRRVLMPIWAAIEQVYAGAMRNCVLICRNKVAPLVGGKSIPLLVRATSDKADIAGRSVKRSLELDTENVGDDWDVDVTLGDPMPSDEAANLRMAIEATAGDNPLLSQQTALTKFKVVQDATEEADRIQVERLYKQFAQAELIKLAVERGWIPGKIEAPEGWQVINGQLVPDFLVPQQEPEAPGPEMGQPEMPQPQMDPAMLQQMSGMPSAPTLEDMAGVPPAMGPEMGGMF